MSTLLENMQAGNFKRILKKRFSIQIFGVGLILIPLYFENGMSITNSAYFIKSFFKEHDKKQSKLVGKKNKQKTPFLATWHLLFENQNPQINLNLYSMLRIIVLKFQKDQSSRTNIWKPLCLQTDVNDRPIPYCGRKIFVVIYNI